MGHKIVLADIDGLFLSIDKKDNKYVYSLKYDPDKNKGGTHLLRVRNICLTYAYSSQVGFRQNSPWISLHMPYQYNSKRTALIPTDIKDQEITKDIYDELSGKGFYLIETRELGNFLITLFKFKNSYFYNIEPKAAIEVIDTEPGIDILHNDGKRIVWVTGGFGLVSSNLKAICYPRIYIPGGLHYVNKHEWDSFWNDTVVLTPGYYHKNQSFRTCKEQWLSYLHHKTFPISFTIVMDKRNDINEKDFLKNIREYQKNLPHPIEIEKVGELTYLFTINSNWWKEDMYYRLGWFLLAVRIASGRETLFTSQLKNKFNQFCEGQFSQSKALQGERYSAMTSTANWVSIFGVR